MSRGAGLLDRSKLRVSLFLLYWGMAWHLISVGMALLFVKYLPPYCLPMVIKNAGCSDGSATPLAVAAIAVPAAFFATLRYLPAALLLGALASLAAGIGIPRIPRLLSLLLVVLSLGIPIAVGPLESASFPAHPYLSTILPNIRFFFCLNATAIILRVYFASLGWLSRRIVACLVFFALWDFSTAAIYTVPSPSISGAWFIALIHLFIAPAVLSITPPRMWTASSAAA